MFIGLLLNIRVIVMVQLPLLLRRRGKYHVLHSFLENFLDHCKLQQGLGAVGGKRSKMNKR